MSRAFELTCVVRDGRIPHEISAAMRDAIRRMDGQRVKISLKKDIRRRSDNQNRFYWGVVVPLIWEMFRDAGNDVTEEDVHEFLKEHVSPGTFVRLMVTPDGKRRSIVRSSTTLNTQEWEDWLTQIRAWAGQFGIVVPLPNENLLPLEKR